MPLDSELLRTFIAVSETSSFTRAAEIVRRTQSAVSLQMKRLEETLGDTLFERGSRGVELTAKGRDLLTNARRVVALLDETAQAFRSPPLDGPVRIGLPEEYGNATLGRALNAFSRQHPDVEVTAVYGGSSENLRRVQKNELDLAVIFEWQDYSDGDVLMIDPTVWATSDVHRMHECQPLPIALYSSSGWCKDFAIRSLEERGIAFRTVFSSDTNGGLRMAVSAGLAVAPLSRSNIPADCRELGAADGFGQIDTSRVVLHRKPRPASEAVDGLAVALRAAFQALHQLGAEA